MAGKLMITRYCPHCERVCWVRYQRRCKNFICLNCFNIVNRKDRRSA